MSKYLISVLLLRIICMRSLFVLFRKITSMFMGNVYVEKKKSMSGLKMDFFAKIK